MRNNKTPSDTTIYAPALNLMPDKNTNNNKSRPGQNLGPVSEQQLTEFLQNVKIQTEQASHLPITLVNNFVGGNPEQLAANPPLSEPVPGPSQLTTEGPAPKSWMDEA